MCRDYENALRNREMIRLKQNISAYVLIEIAIRNCPHRKPLPAWIPQGDVPVVDKSEITELGKYGIHEINNYDR